MSDLYLKLLSHSRRLALASFLLVACLLMTHAIFSNIRYSVSFTSLSPDGVSNSRDLSDRAEYLQARLVEKGMQIAPTETLRTRRGPADNTIVVDIMARTPQRASMLAAEALSVIAPLSPPQTATPREVDPSPEPPGSGPRIGELESMISELQARLSDALALQNRPAASVKPATDASGRTRSDLEAAADAAEDRYFHILQVTGDLSLSPDELVIAGFPELASLRSRYLGAVATGSEAELAEFHKHQKDAQIAAYGELKARKDERQNWIATDIDTPDAHSKPVADMAEIERLSAALEGARAELDLLKKPPAPPSAPLQKSGEPDGIAASAPVQQLSGMQSGNSEMILRRPAAPRPSVTFPAIPSLLFNFLSAAMLAMAAVIAWSLVKLWRHEPTLMAHLLAIEAVHTLHEPSPRDMNQLPPGSRNLAGLIVKRRESSAAEAFRKIRSAIWGQATHEGLRHIATVFSQAPDDTSEAVALGLARTAAFSHRRVLLVDCRNPGGAIEDYLAEEISPGLTDLLAGTAKWEDVVSLDMDSGAHILRFGSAGLPDQGLAGTEFRNIMLEAVKVYDLILLNGGPVLANPLLPGLMDLSPIVVLTTPPPEQQLVEISKTLKQIRSAGGMVSRLIVIKTANAGAA